MGRGKLKMELIKNEKSRNLTFKKRQKGLLKKAYEFTTLCGVKACMIIYGPKLESDSTSTLTTWPPEAAEVKAVIDKYRAATMASGGVKGKKAFDLGDYFTVRRRMVNEEITKVQKANSEAKFPSWNNQIMNLSLDQIRVLNSKIDSKIKAAKAKRDGYLGQIAPNFQNNLEFEALKPNFDNQLVPYDETINSNQQFLVNPMENSMLALLNSGDSSNVTYNGMVAPFFAGGRYHDIPTPSGVLDGNEDMNNHWVVPFQYYQPHQLPIMPMQYQAAAPCDWTPQVLDSWYGGYCVDIKEFEAKNKKPRFY